MLYAPANEFDDTEEHIYSQVKSSDWWWNELVVWSNFVIATWFLTTSIAMAASWSYDCPLIWQFRPDTSYKLFGGQEGMASIFESQKN